MYICKDCGDCGYDDDLGAVYETHGLDTPPYERLSVCPSCGSGELEDAYTCFLCGEVYEESEISCEGVCRKCAIEELLDDYELFKKYLKYIDRQKEFYIGYVNESDPKGVNYNLFILAEMDFDRDMRLSCTKDEAKDIIKQYLEDDWQSAAEFLYNRRFNKSKEVSA